MGRQGQIYTVNPKLIHPAPVTAFDPYTDIAFQIAADLDDFNGTSCLNQGSGADLTVNTGTPTAGSGYTTVTEAGPDSLTLPIVSTTNTYELWLDFELDQTDFAAIHDYLQTAHESYHNTGGAVRVGVGGASYTTTGTLSIGQRVMMRITWSGSSSLLEIREKDGTVFQAEQAWTSVDRSPNASGWVGKFDGKIYQVFKKETTLLTAQNISDMWTWYQNL